jgi:hypothetical protein
MMMAFAVREERSQGLVLKTVRLFLDFVLTGEPRPEHSHGVVHVVLPSPPPAPIPRQIIFPSGKAASLAIGRRWHGG